MFNRVRKYKGPTEITNTLTNKKHIRTLPNKALIQNLTEKSKAS